MLQPRRRRWRGSYVVSRVTPRQRAAVVCAMACCVCLPGLSACVCCALLASSTCSTFSDSDTLAGRVIDRSIRPLFVDGYGHEVQVGVTPACSTPCVGAARVNAWSCCDSGARDAVELRPRLRA